MGSRSKPNIWLLSALMAAFLAAIPLASILWSLPQGGATGWSHLWQTTLPPYLINSSILLLLVAFLTALIGISTAWLVTAWEFPGRRIFTWMLILPLASPAYIIAYIYTDLLAFAGPVQSGLRAIFGWEYGDYWLPNIRSLPGAALVLSLVLYPYVYLLTRAAFAAQSLSQFQAARTLGAGPSAAFFRIVLPSARLAIVGGLALVMMETLADFGVAEYFAIPTFSTGIFRNWLAMGDKLAAMKLAAIMLLFVITLLWLEAASRKGRVDSQDTRSLGNARTAVSGKLSVMAFLFCALPILLGFILPVAVLINYAILSGDGQDWPTLSAYLYSSLYLAAIVSVISVGIALLLAYIQRQSDTPAVQGVIRLATLGYALPGALLAVGLLTPLGVFDQWITALAKDNLGYGGALLLTGTSAILIYALVVRFLTVSYNSMTSGLGKIPTSFDAAARSLGAPPTRVIGKIHLPMLRSNIAAAGALVFVDVLRELPATLILRPFNLETLATRVYRLASDERIAEASTAALLILLAGLLPVILLSSWSDRSQRQ